jgi:hypothetical protein
MDKLWSFSTTIRNPERISDFLHTIASLDGYEWTNETQMRLQAMLIKDRLYIPKKDDLSSDQISLLENIDVEMTYEEARKIFNDKKYVDPPMRGRTSFDPVEKTGLVHIIDGKIKISELGTKYLNGEFDFGEVIFRTMLKQQYPNPLVSGYDGYNTKPFINTLRIIKAVNLMCEERGLKPKGISREEFGIFVLSLKNYLDVEMVAKELLEFRMKKDNILRDDGKRKFVSAYTKNYLCTFQDPVKNTIEYSDNMIRVLRLTRFIYIRGNGFYIDLEPRRIVEIESLLEADNGAALTFAKDQWISFMSNFDSYPLPWETQTKLVLIKKVLLNEIYGIENELNLPITLMRDTIKPSEIQLQIDELKGIRTDLQTKLLKKKFQIISNIDIVIEEFKNIRSLNQKASIELERLSNIALNIINDAISIKPNYPIGDDNNPTFTAPSKVPDIECYYKEFSAICEVTMLTGRDQWFNEGQPVMRHLREFEANQRNQSYCLFIAPRLHQDTINTFWTSVKYEYQGIKQKIIPITIDQLISVLEVVKTRKAKGQIISHKVILELYDLCTSVDQITDSLSWKRHIDNQVIAWTHRV